MSVRVLPALALALGFASRLTAAVPPNFDDAPLRAVQFADRNEGWAVGDHGVVWHSIDGGKTWERQRTGTRASLRAVHFLTPYTGWAVGRIDLPTDAGSQGVVLATADGGGTWVELTSSTLPGLNAVRFFDENNGIVAGDGTDAFPTGAFVTRDGGRSWLPVSGPRATSWTAAEFSSPTSGTVGGAWGRLMLVRDGKLMPAEFDPLDGRAIRGIASDGTRAVAACDGGRVLTSSTNGTKWGFANLPMPAAAVDAMDLKCAAAAGNHVWVAGRPGSVVFHSPDFGKTWEAQKTGQPVPINAVCMIDEQTGWAVGELGTILATADGGKTWAVKKCGGLKAGVMFAHARAGRVPLSTVAAVGGRDGYLTAAVALTSADPMTADPKRAADEFRLAAAMRGCGGAVGESVWGFPAAGYEESPARSASEDNTTPPARASGWSGDLVRQLVLSIRTWRPEVIVADPFPAADGADKAVLVALQDAFKKAADPAEFPEQIEHLGLTPHAAKKLYALSADATDAAVKLDLDAFASEIADSPRDAAEPFAGLIASTAADRQCFRLLSHRLKGADLHANLTDGAELAEGGAGRRPKPTANPLAGALLADRENAARARRQLEVMALHPEVNGGAEKTLVHVAGSLVKMPDDMACRAAVGLGRQLAAEGKWTAAREMFALAAEKYPAHPEAAEAMRWLARFYSSSEVRRRIELGQQVVFQKAAFSPTADIQQTGRLEAGSTLQDVYRAGGPQNVQQLKQTYQFSSPEAAKAWNQACLDLEPKLAGFGVGFARDPATNLCLLAARRQLGLYGDASKAAAALVRGAGGIAPAAGSDPWRDCVAAELWLGNPQAVPYTPKPMGVARKAAVKPLLDGKLDDACWNDASPLPLADAAGATAKLHPSRARVAFDDGFLYLAVECGHPETQPEAAVAKRGYDADLRGQDRVEVLLDLDRDYQTYYRLCIDRRGRVAEDCWGDRGWNPKWFVAVEPTPTGWTAEVAIPLNELTGTPPAPGTVWAANVVRVLPGRGVQAASAPADAAPRPEGMGLLRFQDK